MEDRVKELKSEVFDILVQIENLTAIKNMKLQEIQRLQKEGEKECQDIRV